MASFSENPTEVEFTDHHGNKDHASLHARGRKLYVRTSTYVFEISSTGTPIIITTHYVHDIERLGGVLNA